MKMMKYEHACFTIEKDGTLLVVDPGEITNDFSISETIGVVVITHEHSDHFSPNILHEIITKNPHAIIVGHDNMMRQINDLPTVSVRANEHTTIAGFQLEFFGGTHATIHSSYPPIANLGVLIEEKVYYPGDSFALPQKPVDVLALPVSAPWLKISESIDFLQAVHPRIVVPTHDGILSDAGKRIVDRMISQFAANIHCTYYRSNESLEV